MNISYEYYRIFYYIAKYKNLTLAAEALCSNQPNLSRTVRLLEHELGCQLLIRSNRGISLTPEGEHLYSRVKIAVEQIQAAEEELNTMASLQNGSVTIGASETGLRLLLLPLLHEFKEAHPQIRIRIQNHLTSQAITSVKQGLVDFAVVAVASFGDIPKSLKATSLVRFQDILICGNDFSALSKCPVSLANLKKYPLVCLGEHTMTYRFYDEFYRSHNQVLNPEFEAATTDQILPMIKSNLGLGFVPEIFAREALSAGEVHRIPLKEALPYREIYLVENKERPLTIAAGTLKNMLIKFSAQNFSQKKGN
ncbi:MAG: LysR family transcriptional regulator [Lachnospiraceae bacterium]|nr:LysR family transcriptional regulator [Lachnospiraceae bacterium]